MPLIAWKAIPSGARVTPDGVWGNNATEILPGRQYYTATYVMFLCRILKPYFEHPTCKGETFLYA